MGMPVIGHLDREFLEIMNRTKDLLAKTFETANEFTIPISGTGSAGMETSLVNFIEPGDRVLMAKCIFRSNSSTDSGANRPPIPIESIH
jgi:alanine-glyoxylate transaminase/serine-glyoxylate transaminase/serine-pyruvate transaminase